LASVVEGWEAVIIADAVRAIPRSAVVFLRVVVDAILPKRAGPMVCPVHQTWGMRMVSRIVLLVGLGLLAAPASATDLTG
jgi:hypothetical protein